MKSGTSTLAKYLDLHPDACMQREIDWLLPFGTKWTEMSQAEYEALFEASKARGEVTSHYDHAIDHISRVYPGIKMVYLVRDPIVRFVSEIRHMRTHPWDGRSPDFYDIDNILSDYWSGHHVRWQISAGFYDRVIRRIERRGFPLLIINFTDLVHHQQLVWDRLCEFLGIDPFVTEYLHEHSSEGRVMVTLRTDQREQLEAIYADCIAFMRERGIEFGP